MTEIHHTDIAIIGAGPIGLFAVFECGMMNMRCHVIDPLAFIGGQCSALYPEKPIYDVAGHPGITGQALIDNLEQQARPFEPTYHLDQLVTSLAKTDDGFTLTTSKETVIHAKAVMIAAGCGAFGPNRPPLDGLADYEATGSVAYLITKQEQYRDKRLVIAGGGDSAVDWAIALSDIADHIHVIHRRNKFRCAPESSKQLAALADAGKITLEIPYQLDRLEGDNGQLSHVILKNFDGETKSLPADHLLPFYGLSMELGPILDWNLAIEKQHITVNPATCETSIEGIYAIGDINQYEGKLKLMVCGFSEAAMAAHAAYPRVHPDTAYHFEYSTTKFSEK